MESVEHVILSNLVHNEAYMRKAFPFIQREYFLSEADAIVFEEIHDFITKYNACPTVEAIEVQVAAKETIPEHLFEDVEESLAGLAKKDPPTFDWLVTTTEKFCKDKALYNAISRTVKIYEGQEKGSSNGMIPSILQDALSVCFDTNIGHDYLEDAASRWEFYNRVEEKVPFDIELLNKVTDNGLARKTLTVLISESGGGKSLAMCHMAAANLRMGKNVLYITNEMAEERIAQRIDANLMGVVMNDLKNMPREEFSSRIKKLRERSRGKLIIKEYPTSSAHAGHYRALLNDLALKKNFHPDIIYVDYINICASSRYKASSATNSYTLVRAIAEELRGLAMEFNLPLVSATQVNRSGYGSTDLEMTDTADSMGLVHTVDLMLGVMSSEEHEQMGQVLFKQLKNRYSNPNYYRRFLVGVNKAQMKLFDIDIKAQSNISDQGQTDDKPLITKPRSDYSGLIVD